MAKKNNRSNNNSNNAWIIILVIVLVLVFFGGFGMMNLFGGDHMGYDFGWFFGIIALLAAIWVIYDVLINNKKLSDGMKVLWIIFAIFFSIITAVIYFLVGRNNQNDLFDGKKAEEEQNEQKRTCWTIGNNHTCGNWRVFSA